MTKLWEFQGRKTTRVVLQIFCLCSYAWEGLRKSKKTGEKDVLGGLTITLSKDFQFPFPTRQPQLAQEEKKDPNH